MNTMTRYLALSTLLALSGSLTALEIRKPTDLNYAVEIYEKNGSGHNELICSAVSFRNPVVGMPLHKATNLTLKAPISNATIVTVDKETDEIVQKFTFSEPLRNNYILELVDCKENDKRKNTCTLNYEVVSPSVVSHNEKLKQIDALLEEIDSAGKPHNLGAAKAQLDFHNALEKDSHINKSQTTNDLLKDLDDTIKDLEAQQSTGKNSRPAAH